MDNYSEKNYKHLKARYLELNRRYIQVSKRFEEMVNAYRLLPMKTFMKIVDKILNEVHK